MTRCCKSSSTSEPVDKIIAAYQPGLDEFAKEREKYFPGQGVSLGIDENLGVFAGDDFREATGKIVVHRPGKPLKVVHEFSIVGGFSIFIRALSFHIGLFFS